MVHPATSRPREHASTHSQDKPLVLVRVWVCHSSFHRSFSDGLPEDEEEQGGRRGEEGEEEDTSKKEESFIVIDPQEASRMT